MLRILIPLTLLATGAVALAADVAERREAELAEIRGEIARLEARLGAMRSRETTLAGRVASVRVELELQERQVAEAVAAHELATVRQEATAAKVAELEAALVGVRHDLRRRLGGLYRLGRHGTLRLLLSLEGSDGGLLPAIRQLRFLVRRDQADIARYVTTRDRLAEERVRLDAQREEAAAWRRQEETRRGELVAVRRRQEALLREAAAERERLAAEADALADKERKLSRLVASLAEAGGEPLEGAPIGDFRGALDWPHGGEVVGRFGPRRDPRYRTEVPHDGIDIACEPGDPVRVVYPGKVLFAAPFEGYGPMVVVHHPGRVFTLYAGLGELGVAKGAVVSLGDVLGVATDRLYFEIRSENRPVDPLGWLR